MEMIECTCPSCNGCGEGMYEGSTCTNCRGSGVQLEELTDDDEEEVATP
jgi:hypothetical protein